MFPVVKEPRPVRSASVGDKTRLTNYFLCFCFQPEATPAVSHGDRPLWKEEQISGVNYFQKGGPVTEEQGGMRKWRSRVTPAGVCVCVCA